MEKTSHSKCERFKSCPLRGYFGDIAFYGPDFIKPKDYAFTGSYTHDSIETWFKRYMEDPDMNIVTLADPGKHFIFTMKEVFRAKEHRIIDMDDRAAIILCLRNFIGLMMRRYNYLKHKGQTNKFLPVFIEKEYFKVINGVPLHGYIDAAFEDDAVWIFDWKTNKDGHIKDEYKRQGTRYVMLSEHDFTKPVNEFYVINLRKPVDLNKSRVSITFDMKKQQEIELKEAWDLMTGTHFPKKPGDCFFCDFKVRCKRYPLEGVILDVTQDVAQQLIQQPIIQSVAVNSNIDTMADWW